MYIIDRLNETILQQYHIVISSSVNVYEVNGVTGEGRFISNYVNPDAKYVVEADDLVDELLDIILDYIENIADVEITTDELYDSIVDEEEKIGFWVINTLNDRNHVATQAETEAWLEGKQFLYDHEIAFTISINGAKITNEILQDLMFMDYKKSSDDVDCESDE